MSTYYGMDGELHYKQFDAKKYWRSKEHDCPYAEGNRCFIVKDPCPESCKGCRWYKWYKEEQEE